MLRVPVNPEILQWARGRGGHRLDAMTVRFPNLEAWERGERQPTLKQLEAFAKATHTPVGYFFLPEPPTEEVPIPDFRTVSNQHLRHPSPDLLDTIYLCQQRQDWYRDYAVSMREPKLEFVGSATVSDEIVETAARMRRALDFDVDDQRRLPTWTDALRRFIERADASGVLVMVSGVVGNNNRRKLDPNEFRGFAMSDPVAPLVFVNGADTKAAQMFTLAHELAHLWIGQTAVSDAQARHLPDQKTEQWCNQIAAEFLVPLKQLRTESDDNADLANELKRLARRFKVSSLVILRRLHDAGRLDREEMWAAYDDELSRLRAVPKSSGGDFYLSLGARVSKRFAGAVVTSTLEGRTGFTESFRMLGFNKMSTFNELSNSLGVGYRLRTGERRRGASSRYSKAQFPSLCVMSIALLAPLPGRTEIWFLRPCVRWPPPMLYSEPFQHDFLPVSSKFGKE